MPLNKDGWYDRKEIEKTGANWVAILGARGPGKSWQMKDKWISDFVYKGTTKVFVRRQKGDVTSSKMNQYFNDFVTKGNLRTYCSKKYPDYDDFTIEFKTMTFSLFGHREGEKPIKLADIGWATSLSTGRDIKSLSFPTTDAVIFEEVMEEDRSKYLDNELSKLQQIVSTVRRNRSDFKVYMIANTLDRECPIFHEMGLDLKKQPINTIQSYTAGSRGNTIAVELVEGSPNNSEETEKFFDFGNVRERMIVKGEWAIDECQCFKDEDLYNASLRDCVILDSPYIRLYCYFSTDGKVFVLDRRAPGSTDYDVTYLTLTTGNTVVNRNTFAWISGLKQIDVIKKVLLIAELNGFMYFDSNETGDSYQNFLRLANK